MSRKYKILLISNMYPSDDYPSYGVFVRNTEKILKESGFYINKIILIKENNKYIKLIKYIIYYLKIIFKGIIFKYDVFYVHYASYNALPLILLKKLKKNINIIINVHGSDVVPEKLFQKKFEKYTSILLNLSNVVIVPSNYFKNYVSEKYKIDNNKIKIFPSAGINEQIFYKLDNRGIAFDNLGISHNFKYIGYVGRIDIKKGWDTFVKAIAMLKEEEKINDVKFIIVGGGSQISEFKSLINKFKLQDTIIYFELLPQEKLLYVYNCLEVFCFPTMRIGESLGLVGIEAMACGVPVIGSNIGGLKDYIIDGYNGFFFEPGNPVSLKEKILDFLKLNNDEKEKMKNNALKTSKKYEVDNIKENLIKIFNDGKEDTYEKNN